jgi:dTDP-4-amino-4,6-dideoxygalactose transaminase
MVVDFVTLFDIAKVTDEKKLTSIASRVIKSNQHILSQNVVEFENKFAEYLGAKHCYGVANGSDALLIALRSIGITAHDEVATVANAGFYTCAALNQIGATPIFVDVDSDSLLMDPEDLEKKISNNNIKAVVVTHLYGQVAPIEVIAKICKNNAIGLVEDCAQAHGGQVNGKKVGTFGDVATFSFYPTKNLGAIGDGGAVVTNYEEPANNIVKLRQYGWDEKYHVKTKFGVNSRLDEIQAAFLIEKLNKLDFWNAQRISIANQYQSMLKETKVQVLKNTLQGVAHLFVIKTNSRNDLSNYLFKNNIQSGIHYPVADHKQEVFENKFENLNLPVTNENVDKILSLPIYPGMPQDKIEHVIKVVNDY